MQLSFALEGRGTLVDWLAVQPDSSKAFPSYRDDDVIQTCMISHVFCCHLQFDCTLQTLLSRYINHIDADHFPSGLLDHLKGLTLL